MGPSRSNVPLSDFFGSTFHNNFTPINTLQPHTCFQHYTACLGIPFVPTGPDSDDGD